MIGITPLKRHIAADLLRFERLQHSTLLGIFQHAAIYREEQVRVRAASFIQKPLYKLLSSALDLFHLNACLFSKLLIQPRINFIVPCAVYRHDFLLICLALLARAIGLITAAA
ncbi:hypothetical protein D3C78_1231080 [compost metagenome]